MHVAIIGGGGTIGSTVAYTLATTERGWDITLVDVAADTAKGHAIDLSHARTVGQIPGLTTQALGEGHVQAESPESARFTDVDCVVVTASAPAPEGGKQRGGRIEFLRRNRSLAETLGGSLAEHEPVPVVVGSNPLDIITYHFWRATGWDRHRFVGYSLSDTARVIDEVARLFECRPSDVYCPVLGEHGEHIVPLFSRLTVDDQPVDIDEAERERVREYATAIPYDVIDLRGAADSSRWVTGQGIAQLVRTMFATESSDPLGLSVPLDGEYGFADVCLSVPIRLSADGWSTVVEWDLSDDERSRLQGAYDAVSADLS